jgi:hypothetical protein
MSDGIGTLGLEVDDEDIEGDDEDEVNEGDTVLRGKNKSRHGWEEISKKSCC